MKKQTKFEVFVSGVSSSVEEWKRALEAPKSELPELSAQQKEIARKFGVSDEDYGRGVFVGSLGEKRIKSQGEHLGNVAEGILGALGPDYHLQAVIAEMVERRWILRIQTPEVIVPVEVPRELADDLLDSGTVDEVEKLKICLLSALERKKVIAGK